MFSDFGVRFGAESGPGRARKVFKKLPGGGALHSDRIGVRGEPRGPRSFIDLLEEPLICTSIPCVWWIPMGAFNRRTE